MKYLHPFPACCHLWISEKYFLFYLANCQTRLNLRQIHTEHYLKQNPDWQKKNKAQFCKCFPFSVCVLLQARCLRCCHNRWRQESYVAHLQITTLWSGVFVFRLSWLHGLMALLSCPEVGTQRCPQGSLTGLAGLTQEVHSTLKLLLEVSQEALQVVLAPLCGQLH